jgi:hypothetical protein
MRNRTESDAPRLDLQFSTLKSKAPININSDIGYRISDIERRGSRFGNTVLEQSGTRVLMKQKKEDEEWKR